MPSKEEEEQIVANLKRGNDQCSSDEDDPKLHERRNLFVGELSFFIH